MMNIMKRKSDINPKKHSSTHQSALSNSRLHSQNERIYSENRQLYHRLENQRPTISNQRLLEDRKKNVKILKFLGKYPNQTAYSKSFELRKRESETQISRNQIIHEPLYDVKHHDEELAACRKQLSALKGPESSLSKHRNKTINETSKKILYQ